MTPALATGRLLCLPPCACTAFRVYRLARGLLNKMTPAVATDRLVWGPLCVCPALCVYHPTPFLPPDPPHPPQYAPPTFSTPPYPPQPPPPNSPPSPPTPPYTPLVPPLHPRLPPPYNPRTPPYTPPYPPHPPPPTSHCCFFPLLVRVWKPPNGTDYRTNLHICDTASLLPALKRLVLPARHRSCSQSMHFCPQLSMSLPYKGRGASAQQVSCGPFATFWATAHVVPYSEVLGTA